MAAKRKVEVFSAGCPACDETVKMVQNIACPSCDVSVLDMDRRQARRLLRRTRAGGGDPASGWAGIGLNFLG